jgi:Ran GTPase-activating protein (RanGAP) involved in mRNA processing and transport
MQTLSVSLTQQPAPPLVKLKLDHNRSLGVDGAKHLVRALCMLPTLRDLSFADCSAGESGAERFAMFVKSAKFCKLEYAKIVNLLLVIDRFQL